MTIDAALQPGEVVVVIMSPMPARSGNQRIVNMVSQLELVSSHTANQTNCARDTLFCLRAFICDGEMFGDITLADESEAETPRSQQGEESRRSYPWQCVTCLRDCR